jgi:hypothetical protein
MFYIQNSSAYDSFHELHSIIHNRLIPERETGEPIRKPIRNYGFWGESMYDKHKLAYR